MPSDGSNRLQGRFTLLMVGWPLYLTCENFVQAVREALVAAGIESDNYAGCSFRIGAATTAAQCGIQELTIKMLGHWQSAAYMLYIKTPGKLCPESLWC